MIDILLSDLFMYGVLGPALILLLWLITILPAGGMQHGATTTEA